MLTATGIFQKKDLKLKHFYYNDNNKLQTYFINPKTYLRFNEIRLPYDSSFLEDNDKFHQEVPSITDFTDFKRVTKVTYNKPEKIFVVETENYFPENMNHVYNEKQVKYYLDWMKSHGHSKAKYVCDALTKMLNTGNMIKSTVESLKLATDKSKRFLKKLSDKTVN